MDKKPLSKGSPDPRSQEAQRHRDKKDSQLQEAIRKQADEKFRALLEAEQRCKEHGSRGV